MEGFKDEVTLVLQRLTEAVVTEILTEAGKVSLNKLSPEVEQKLCALVGDLCRDAVEKILRMATLMAVKQDERNTEPLQMSPGDPHADGLHDEAQLPSEHTVVFFCENAAAESSCLLVEVQSDAPDANEVNGEDRRRSVPSGEATAHVSSAPPPPVDDHEYARPPPGSPTLEGGGVNKQRKKVRMQSWAAPHVECSQCAMLFPNAERLDDHRRKSHPSCSACGAVFTGILRLREHEISEHGLLPHACDYCAKRFNHKTHRDLHVKARHTGEKTCHCDVCGKGYSCVSVLKTHRMTHFEKTFICDVCGRGFYHACHLTRHKLVHQDERPHRCAVCGKGFTQAANLRSHQATHSRERQLCSVCGKSFRCLRNHVVSKHSHELPADQLPARLAVFSCAVCGKKFPSASQRRVHQRSHSGGKPHHCDVCGKSFRLRELLRDHRLVHSGETPYRCSLCDKTFDVAASFTRHRGTHSGETPHSCEACDKHFRLPAFLKAHLQTKAHLKQLRQRQTDAPCAAAE